MTRTERVRFLLVWALLGCLPLFMRPLWEPDEARYAEIPREMLATGDWLAPRLNGVLYFEKPPLQYWLGAASMKLFGQGAAAARLPLALASLLTLWCAWRLARRLGARNPLWAAFMAATALLGYVCGQILTLDALFSALMLATLVSALEAVTARAKGEPALGWTLGAFAAMALATLTKGIAAPVLVGGAFLASLPWADRAVRGHVLRVLFHPLGWLVFLGLAAPWFILVERAHPGHARFFFVHEHFTRFTTHEHAREGSKNPLLDKAYFTAILLVGLVPWASSAVTGLRRAFGFVRRPRGPQGPQAGLHRWAVALSVAGAAVPLAFFSLSGSKLPPYILPCLVPLLALGAALEREGEEPKALARMGRELLGLGLLLLVAVPFLLKRPEVLAWPLASGLGLALTGLWCLRPRGLTAPRLMASLGASLLLLTYAAQRAEGDRKSVRALLARAPREAQWVSVGNYYQGIPFHTGERVPVVAGTGELAFGRDQLSETEKARWFQEDLKDLEPLARRLVSEAPARPLWALVDRDAWKELGDGQRTRWELVARSPNAYLARRLP